MAIFCNYINVLITHYGYRVNVYCFSFSVFDDDNNDYDYDYDDADDGISRNGNLRLRKSAPHLLYARVSVMHCSVRVRVKAKTIITPIV